MGLGKMLMYGFVCYCCFSFGRHLERGQIQQGPYQLLEQRGHWFLQAPNGVHEISEHHQVGTVSYRMHGLLEEKVEDLKDSLRKITQRESQ